MLLAGLGVHTVVDLVGRVRLGPDVEYVVPADEYDYAVDPAAREKFFSRASSYLPFLSIDDLSPDIAGVRPKLSASGQAARDFYIAEESARLRAMAEVPAWRFDPELREAAE